jgi:GTP cyclohydrolase FolE2
MIITNLEKMEKIVSRNRNLSWIGWDIADRKRSDSGRTSVSGVRIKGEWYLQRIYPVTKQGWDIPNKYKV